MRAKNGLWLLPFLLSLSALRVALSAEDRAGDGGAAHGEEQALDSALEEEQAHDYYPHKEEHHGHDVYAVLLPWMVQALGIAAYFILTRYLHAVPYTAVLFIVGVFMGLGASLTDLDDQLTSSILMWTHIDSEVLFTVFLPGLLFKDALEINFHLFQASISQLLILAFPMVLAGTMLTAVVAQYVFPYGWSFHQCLTFGSILAATDPVAVSALLNEVGAPPRLKLHVSGESLLNDGSAVVFFHVFGGLFLYDLNIEGDGLAMNVGVKDAFEIFFRMSLGGVSVGIAFALALVLILYKLDRRMEREETVLQVTATVTIAYLSFYTAEVVCAMSGVIAVVTCGILTKAFGGGMISDWQVMDSFWGLLEHLLNTVIFALGGIVFGSIIGRKGLWEGIDWGYLAVLYVLVNGIRFFLIFAFFPINSRIGLGTNWREAVFSSWGGLRGAVGITLALALDNAVIAETDDPEKLILTTKMFGMVGGIALFTLIINGMSSGPLLAKLGLGDSTESRQRIVKSAEEATRRRVLDDFLHLMTDKRFYFVDFALVVHHCPLLRDLTAKELQTAIDQNKESVSPSLYKAPRLDHVIPYIKDSAAVTASIVRAQRDFFSSSGADGGRRLSTFAEDESPEEEQIEATPALLRDTRLMFVELLRAVYTSQIKDGELDPREYNGFLVYVLFQGLDFAHDAVSAGEPLSDWKSSHIGSAELVNKTTVFADRIFGSCCGKKGEEGRQEGPKGRLRALRDHEPVQYQRLRLNVLRALSFIEAHQEAQDRLRDEFGGETGDSAAAFRAVMNESRAEVKKAKEVLVSQNKKKMKHVISHYLCIILQNKAARYVRLLFDSGVLLQREARHFLEEIDHHIREIRKCPLDKHPNSMDFADELDFQVGRQKRKRVKQKSIL